MFFSGSITILLYSCRFKRVCPLPIYWLRNTITIWVKYWFNIEIKYNSAEKHGKNRFVEYESALLYQRDITESTLFREKTLTDWLNTRIVLQSSETKISYLFWMYNVVRELRLNINTFGIIHNRSVLTGYGESICPLLMSI